MGLRAIFPKCESSRLPCHPWHCRPGPRQVPQPLLHPDLWQDFGSWGWGVEQGGGSEQASSSSCWKGLGAASSLSHSGPSTELGTRGRGQFQALVWPPPPGELTVVEGLTPFSSLPASDPAAGWWDCPWALLSSRPPGPEGSAPGIPGKVISALLASSSGHREGSSRSRSLRPAADTHLLPLCMSRCTLRLYCRMWCLNKSISVLELGFTER